MTRHWAEQRSRLPGDAYMWGIAACVVYAIAQLCVIIGILWGHI